MAARHDRTQAQHIGLSGSTFLIMGISTLFLESCATPQVEYGELAVPLAGSSNSSATQHYLSSRIQNRSQVEFRFPRSQISLSQKTTKTPPENTAISNSVIDVLDTQGVLIALPGSPGFAYSLHLDPVGGEGAVPKATYLESATKHETSTFPAPACGLASVNIYQRHQNGSTLIPIQLSAQVSPTEFSNPTTIGATADSFSKIYVIQPKNSFAQTTIVNPTYVTNTKLIQKLDISVTDKINTYIKDAAAIASAVIPFLAAAQSPKLGDPNVVAENDKSGAWDLIGTIRGLTVVDPNNVEPVFFPLAGSVTLGSVCGASISSTSSSSTAALDDITLAATSAQAAYKSLPAAPAPKPVTPKAP